MRGGHPLRVLSVLVISLRLVLTRKLRQLRPGVRKLARRGRGNVVEHAVGAVRKGYLYGQGELVLGHGVSGTKSTGEKGNRAPSGSGMATTKYGPNKPHSNQIRVSGSKSHYSKLQYRKRENLVPKARHSLHTEVSTIALRRERAHSHKACHSSVELARRVCSHIVSTSFTRHS